MMTASRQNRIDRGTLSPYTSQNRRAPTIRDEHANMTTELDTLSVPQRDRLAFMELLLNFLGEFQRHDLVARFGIQSAAATRDISLYKRLRPGNLDYDTKSKTYRLGTDFIPLFHFSPERVLSWITQNFGDGEPSELKAWLATDMPARLTQPSLDILSVVTRAIHQGCVLAMQYHSLSSGLTQREIVPFALIDNGQRWHVRGYDRLNQDFRDFVITRIREPRLLGASSVHPHEHRDHDIQWTRIVELDLVPHPDQPRPEITELDYGMTEGRLRVRLRAATAGYVLRVWNVDCSPDHCLRGPEIRLWLRDPLTLYGVRNALLAPGYTPPTRSAGSPA